MSLKNQKLKTDATTADVSIASKSNAPASSDVTHDSQQRTSGAPVSAPVPDGTLPPDVSSNGGQNSRPGSASQDG